MPWRLARPAITAIHQLQEGRDAPCHSSLRSRNSFCLGQLGLPVFVQLANSRKAKCSEARLDFSAIPDDDPNELLWMNHLSAGGFNIRHGQVGDFFRVAGEVIGRQAENYHLGDRMRDVSERFPRAGQFKGLVLLRFGQFIRCDGA